MNEAVSHEAVYFQIEKSKADSHVCVCEIAEREHDVLHICKTARFRKIGDEGSQ